MGSRILSAILGYIIPFALLVSALFLLEMFIESAAGLIFVVMNYAVNLILPNAALALDTTPDFPGPMTLINASIIAFPSIFDIGTTIFWSSVEDITFIIYAILTLVTGFLSWTAIVATRDSFLDISTAAGEKVGVSTRMDDYGTIDGTGID